MKRLFSILLAGLIIASSIHLTVATHYCGGSFEAFKLSVSNDKASCGMEANIPVCSNEKSIGHHCCTDKFASYLINDNYSASSFHFVKAPSTAFAILLGNLISTNAISAHTECKSAPSPPGDCLPSMVELASICIFRI